MPYRSLVWNYFTRVNPELASCNTCKREIRTKGGNTTAMSSHLKSIHFFEYQQLQERKEETFSSEHSYSDEYSEFSNEDSMGNCGPSDNGQESPELLVVKSSASLRSEMAEVSSLLSLAMPMANVSFLVDEGEGKDDAVAVEVRPRDRLFRVSLNNYFFWGVG